MESIGENIKKLRVAKKITLANAAIDLNMEETILADIENGNKKVSPKDLIKIETYYKTITLLDYENEFEERDTNQNLNLREDAVTYGKIAVSKKNEIIITHINSFLKADNRIGVAYLFGSYARGEESQESDIDLMVEFKTDKNYSFFDLLDIAFFLEKKINIKVDIVEKGFIYDFAMQSASNDLIKIYG